MPPALTAITSLSNIKNSQKSFVFSLHCALIRSVVLEEGGGGARRAEGGRGVGWGWVLSDIRYILVCAAVKDMVFKQLSLG